MSIASDTSLKKTDYSFPKELLGQSAEARIEYFKKYRVLHNNLKEARNKLFNEIDDLEDTSIVLVYGPTGVGKTTLFTAVAEMIYERSLSSLEQDPGLIPVAGVEAIAPENGNFNWKDHYIRCLKSLKEPLIDKKIKEYQSQALLLNGERPDVAGYREALENALRYRKLTAYLIDEAQHLTKMTSGRKLKNQMDTIKSIASKSTIPHILFGTYELLEFRNLSGQLIRRSSDIHFARYKADNDDMQHFINALGAFQTHLPLEIEPSLVDDYEFFYQRSIGCIGILKKWLLKTLIHAVRNKKKTITIDDCDMLALSADKCVRLIIEAKESEKRLEEDKKKEQELIRLLDMEESQEKISADKKTNRKPGDRNPTRDTVGEIKHA